MEKETRRFLNVGCGNSTKQDCKGFSDWSEVRFDIDRRVKPDIIGSVTDLSAVGDESVDAVYSSHNVEHVYPHEVPRVLSEFRRVLKPSGFVVVTCPDLTSVCKRIVERGLDAVLYDSPAGSITGLDILYGHNDSVASGNLFMAHKGGFTHETLARKLGEAGFKTLLGAAIPKMYAIWMLAYKSERPDQLALADAARYLPALT